MNLNDYSLWTALVTPLTPGLEVDYKSLEKLVKEQCEAKNGLLVLGSTGEALNLDLETRKNIVNFVLELKPSSPLMIGFGGHALPDQQEWLKWLESKSIDAYLMVTPIYAKPGSHGQYEWFKVLMDQSTKPVMLYNVPGRAGIELCFKAVSKLKNHKNFWAIKEASGSVAKMQQYLAASDNGRVFCGDDALLPEFTGAGSCGLVSVASNTWPAETNLYVEKCLDKTFDAKELWSRAANSLFVASNPIPAKALLASENRIAHDTMMPPLSRRDLNDLVVLKSSSEDIRNWYRLNK
jgi:4-hydroxy-tetrahydrodipicolinate synthase